MKKVDLPVGTKFYVDGVLLTVKEGQKYGVLYAPCDGCYFYKAGIVCSCQLSCAETNRRDRVDVVFKKVEEKQ